MPEKTAIKSKSETTQTSRAVSSPPPEVPKTKEKTFFRRRPLLPATFKTTAATKAKASASAASVAISGESMGQNRPADSGPGIRLTDASKGQNNNNAIGYGSDGDSKNSTTRSGINTRNIHITDEAGHLPEQAGLPKKPKHVSTPASTPKLWINTQAV